MIAFLREELDNEVILFSIAEKVLASIRPLKPQESKKKNLETGAALWNTVYAELTPPPPKKL